MARLGKGGASRIFFLWMLEFAVLVGAVRLAWMLRFRHEFFNYGPDFSAFLLPRAALFALVLCVALTAFGLHHVHLRQNRFGFLLREFYAFVFGGIGLMVVYYVFPTVYLGRGVLVLSLLIGFGAIALLRAIWDAFFRSASMKSRVLVLGAGATANFIERRLRRASDRRNFRVIGFVPVEGEEVMVDPALLVRIDRGIDEMARLLDANEILVAIEGDLLKPHSESLLQAVSGGVRVCDLPSFIEREAGMVSVSEDDPSWLLFSRGMFDHSLPRRLNKRAFDVTLALVLLVLTAPLMVLVAIAVSIESGFPVLYKQTRVGIHGKLFEVIKFRSMRKDAEKDGVARWAKRDDDRITRVGKIIRLTRLDELPQLINVLRGDMSLVGPRPERPQFVDSLNQEIRYYNMRHSVRPGLTGWAQLRYPYGASVKDAEEKLRYDLFYVKNHSFMTDLMILLQTVEVVLLGRGAR